MILHILLAYLALSALFTALWIIAGLRISRMQERNRFAWDKPLRYLELGADEYERIETPEQLFRRAH